MFFEEDCELIVAELCHHHRTNLNVSHSIMQIELFSDFLTTDPISTFFGLGWQIPAVLKALTGGGDMTTAFKGYNNNRFLSLYGWSGDASTTPCELYLALTGYPKRSSTNASCFVRFEVRLFPNKIKFQATAVNLPDPDWQGANLFFSPQYVLLKFLELSLPEISRQNF